MSSESQPQLMKAEIDLYRLDQLKLRCYGVFRAREMGETPIPLTPDEVSAIDGMRDFFGSVSKNAVRMCHDCKVYCRFRKSACQFTPEEIRDEGGAEKVAGCKYRGKKL